MPRLVYPTVLASLLVIDFLWLSVMVPLLYRGSLGGLLRPTPDLLAAAVFYVIYAVGLVRFGAANGLRHGRWQAAASDGAIFGFCAYATYDLTNQATLAGWPPLLTIVDLGWGTLLSAITATVGYAVARRLGRPAGA